MKSRTAEGFQLIHDVIKLRWVPEIIAAINQGHHHYNEILKAIQDLSNTELNRKLAVLLENKAIVKIENADQQGYFLSPFGEDLEHIFKHFEDMSEKYLMP